MILKIVEFPNKVLQSPTQQVKFPLSKEIKKLTKDMIQTVRKADGIGLAAPQVNRLVKVIIINLEKSGVPLFALYNAKVVSKSFTKVELEEGCLSIPGVFGKFKRPKKVKVEAQNDKGEKIIITDDGWVSRVMQHEIDHTNGVLILDHIKKYTQGEEIVNKWKKEKLL